MIPLQIVVLLMVAAGATAVVLQRDPLRQVLISGLYGLLLTVLFVVFQAPDVALSMIVVSSIAVPFVVLIAVTRIRGETEDREEP